MRLLLVSRFAAFLVTGCLTVARGDAGVPVVFISPGGAQELGNHTLYVPPGTSVDLSMWLVDNAHVDRLGIYAVVARCHAHDGSAGTVTYQAGSINVDETRPDWVFSSKWPGLFPAMDEDCAVTSPDGFAATSGHFNDDFGVFVTETAYLADFTLNISPDAFGTFVLDWVPGPVGVPFGGSVLIDAAHQPFGTPGIAMVTDWQPLTIVVGVAAGEDRFHTAFGCDASTAFSFGVGEDAPQIPAGFFGPGSDPFVGTVAFAGATWSCDTDVERRGTLYLEFGLPSDPVPTRVTRMDLLSCSPIQVTGKSPFAGAWSVHAGLSPTVPPDGTLEATLDQAGGGTFVSTLNVQPLFTFKKIDSPNKGTVVQLDTAIAGTPPIALSTTKPAPFLLNNAAFEPGMVDDRSWVPCCVEICYESAKRAHRQCFRPDKCVACSSGTLRSK